MPHCCCELKFSFGNSEYPFLSECVSLWVRVDTDVAWRIWQLFRWIRLKLSQVEERKTSRQLSWKVNSICSTSSLMVSHHFSTECTMLLCERANRRVREYVCVCVWMCFHACIGTFVVIPFKNHHFFKLCSSFVGWLQPWKSQPFFGASFIFLAFNAGCNHIKRRKLSFLWLTLWH